MTTDITPTYTVLIDGSGHDMSGYLWGMQQQQLMMFVILAIVLALFLAFKVFP